MTPEHIILIFSFWLCLMFFGGIIVGIAATPIKVKQPIKIQVGTPKHLRHSKETPLTDNEINHRRLQDALKEVRQTVYHCPCGYSTRQASSWFHHQDNCWAWGNDKALVMQRNKLGGFQTKGARFMLPPNHWKGELRHIGKNPLSLPKYPTYSGDWQPFTEPLCGKAWLTNHNWFPDGDSTMIVLCDGQEIGKFEPCQSSAMKALIKDRRR